MATDLHSYRCLLEGEIVLDSTAPYITSGAFCDLFTTTHPTIGKLALKKLRDKSDGRLEARIEIEAKVWASLKHPRILQFLGTHTIVDNVYLVSVFAENGSLPEFIKVRPEVDRKRLVIEISEGLAYLHQCGIIHGDLKGNNVLISGAEHILLCDFGLAKHVTSQTSTSLRGTLAGVPFSDVYAFGITVYEILSGKEPYAHHTGIGSIITSVLFNGERPPKEPEVAPDGSSYFQLWDEASKCWAEDSSLRPRVIDVLNRLDRPRAEALIASQHRVLEDSLIRPFEGNPISQPPSVLGPSSLDPGVSSNQDNLDWALRIRARMNALINAQQPLGRISREVIARIIKIELALSTPMLSQKLPRRPISNRLKPECMYIQRVRRCAQLRMVFRAWRDAVDNTPELTRYILVDCERKNIEYVQRYNRSGSLEFLLSKWKQLDDLSFLLGPLVHRLRSLEVSQSVLSIRPAPFPMLRTIMIYATSVSDSFATDLLGVLHANQDLVELSLHDIKAGGSRRDSPRLRIITLVYEESN